MRGDVIEKSEAKKINDMEDIMSRFSTFFGARVIAMLIISSVFFLPASCSKQPEESSVDRPQAAGTAQGLCAMCSKPLKNHESTLYYLEYEDGSKWTGCCAHCGVVFEYKMRKKGKSKLFRAKTFDYRTHRVIDGFASFYLKDSDEIPCCVPTILAFETKEEVDSFQEAHGGRIYTFEEMQNLPIEQLMAPEKLKMMKEKGVL